MSTPEALRRLIQNFRGFVAEQSSISPTDCQQIKDIAEGIRESCQRFNESERAYVAEILFKDNDDSMLAILKSSFGNSALSEAIKICVEAFSFTVWKLEVADVERYCVPLWNFSVAVCRNEDLKSSRESGFDLLVAIMDQLKLSEMRTKLNARSVIRWCWEQTDLVSKLTNTVKKGLFQLVGALCKYYPELMVDEKKNYANVFAMVMAAELKEQMSSKTKSPVYATIGGCLAGINGVLCNFPEAFECTSNRLTLRELYNCAKMASNPANDMTRLWPKRVALDLLSTHSALFKQYFYTEYKLLYGYFRHLAVHQNRDLKYAGLHATEVLLKELSSELLEQCGKNRVEAETMYKFFVSQFAVSLRSLNSTREVAMCAKGYGQFSAACKALYGSKQLNKLLIDLTSRCEEVFMLSSDPLEQKVTYIPTFLEGFAMVFAAIDEVPSDVWLPVETLHIRLFQHFPLLDPKYYQRCVNMSYQLFQVVLPHNDRYIDTIVYQSLVRLCSLTPSAFLNNSNSSAEGDENDGSGTGGSPAAINSERDPRNFTYRDYLPLWRQLLNASSVKISSQSYFDVDDNNTNNDLTSRSVSDAFFKAIMEMLDRLDFTLQKKEIVTDNSIGQDTTLPVGDVVSSDPIANVVPNKTTDLRLLVNLADFMRDLVDSTYLKSFSEWVFPLSSRLMELSTKFPLISGFYKMLTLCLKVGGKLKLFDISGSGDLYSRFIDEVSVRMKQYKDDLYVSCLELVLAVPSHMALMKLELLAEVIKSSLELGLSYLPLAEACLNALERLTAEVGDLDRLSPLYKSVLPKFDEYLRSEGVQDEAGNAANSLATKRNSKKSLTKKEIWKEKARTKAAAAKKSAEVTRLNDLRIRMLLFIGKLGGEVNKYLIEQTAEENAKKCVAWDLEERLKFNIPFPDMKPSIAFDNFLPRICELALHCGNRQTKIAACELLHSLVLLLLGKAAAKREVYAPESGDGGSETAQAEQRSPFHKLYRRLFPVLLQLCCDADEVPKQLFRTLITQSIHWFTSNRTSDNPETAALLDSLMDGLACRDATLRDYCAENLNEFLKWSLKHHHSSDSAIMKRNFRSLLKRLYSLASHPNSTKRMGAALAFNSIYRTFREQDQFIDAYTFEILAVFMNSLARASNDDGHGAVGSNNCGTVEQFLAVTRHVDRIVQKKKDMLNRRSQIRKVPIGWNGCSLEDCLRWLFEQVPRPQTHFRQRCFELLKAWVPLVDGLRTMKLFVAKFVEGAQISLFEMFENGGIVDDIGGIRKCPSIDCNSATIPTIRAWLNCLEAALDCYQVCLAESIVTSKDIFDATNRGESVVLSSLHYFLEHLALSSLDIRASTPSERRDINSAKCHVIVRTLSFVVTILAETQAISGMPFLGNYWSLLIRCCFNPSSVGFDMTSNETVEQLPRALHSVLSMVKRLPSEVNGGMAQQLTVACRGPYAVPPICDLLVDGRQSSTNWVRLNEHLVGYSITITAGVLPPGYFPGGAELWRDVAQSSFDVIADDRLVARPWLPSALLAARNMLKTAAEVTTNELESILGFVLDQTPVLPHKRATRTSMTKGQAWLGLFRPQIAELVARNAGLMLPTIARLATTATIATEDRNLVLAAEVLVKITDYVARTNELRKRFGPVYIQNAATSCCELLERLADGEERAKCLCVGLMQKLFLIDTKFLPSAAYLFGIFAKFLSSKEADLRFKNKVLYLLGPMAASGEFGGSSELSDALDSFVVTSFPFRSTEFRKGTSDYDEYSIALRRLVFALEVSDSTVILECLIKVLSREKEHSAEVEIAGLLGSYCRNLSPNKYVSIIVVPFNFFFCSDQRIGDEHRLNCLSKFLLPMLNGLNDNVLSRFFCDKSLKMIMEKLKTPLAADHDEIGWRHQIVIRYGCMRLLELMYSRLDLSTLKGRINDEYIDGRHSTEKTELIKKLVEIASEARTLGLTNEPSSTSSSSSALAELKWTYRCAAQNLLIAVISKTQSRARIYEGLIFKNPWNAINDRWKSYAFKIELDDQPKRKQQMLNLQTAWRRSTTTAGNNGSELRAAGGTLQFLSSQFLAESSLQSQVNEYDFSESSSMSMADFASSLTMSNNNGDEDEALSQQSSWGNSQSQSQQVASEIGGSNMQGPMALELEADELNLHPCIEPMINVIKSLVDKGITPINESEMPVWMQQMLESFAASSNVHINTKLMIARIVTILEDIFAPFGDHWFAPLANLCLDDAFYEGGLNYFRVDIIATLLKWSKDSTRSRSAGMNASLKSKLFRYCFTNAPYSNAQMFRRNLRLLNLMLELWKESIQVDANFIHGQMNKADIDQPSTIGTGIQLLGVVLANGVDPFVDNHSLAQDVYKTLSSCLTVKSSKTFKPAAEVVGLLLQVLSQKASDIFDDVERLIESQMRTILSLAQDRAKFVTCLHAIQRHYPRFSDKFLNNVIALLPGLHGEFKSQSLEIIYSRAESIPKLYTELKAGGVLNMLDSAHDSVNQVWAAKMLSKIVDNLSSEELEEITPTLCTLIGQAGAECRRILIEFFMRVYDTRGLSSSSAESMEETSVSAAEMAKEALLSCLSDPEPALRHLVYNFWSHETRLPKNTAGRLLGILQHAYSETTERDFLGHATYLLLELTSRSPDYKQPIFDAPLQDCRFEELHLTTSWKRRYATLQMPAFAESMLSSQASIPPQSPSKSTQMQILATVVVDTPQFSQTIAPGQTAFDWMTGATYDTFAGSTLGPSTDGGDDDGGGLLFAMRSSHRSQRNVAAERSGGGARRMQPYAPADAAIIGARAKQADDEDENLLKQLKRRIIKDNRQSASDYFARMHTRRQKARDKLEQERRTAREQNVQLYRNYRQGDFPDVQIQHSAVLVPLQALAQQDSFVASLLVASLLDGVYREIRSGGGGDQKESENFGSSLADNINRIVSSSKICFKPLLSCLQTFCFRNVPILLQIDPDVMCGASIVGHQQHMAVVLLEKYLLQGGPEKENGEKEPKRRRVRGPTSSSSMDAGTGSSILNKELTAAWSNLAKLYKSIGDRESVRVIFDSKLPSKPITNRALEAENDGDYETAIALYTNAMREYCTDEEEATTLESAELTLWEESRLKCLDLLNHWSDLATVAVKYIDDSPVPNLDQVWENPYSQVVYLPYLLRAKLKLLCSTEEDSGAGLSFVNCLNGWLKDDEKRKWLEHHNANNLTLFALAKREYGAAGHFCKISSTKFLANWSSLLVTDHAARKQSLQLLQELAEMDEFISLVQSTNKSTGAGGVSSILDLERVLKRWEQRTPGVLTDSTDAWSNVLTTRHLCVEQLCQNLVNTVGVPEREVYRRVLKSELRTSLQSVTNALHMRNYGLAFSTLDKAKDQLAVTAILHDDDDDEQSISGVEWVHAYARTQLVVVTSRDQFRFAADPKKTAERLITALSLLGRSREKAVADAGLDAAQALLEGTITERLGWLRLNAAAGKNNDDDWTAGLDVETARALLDIGYDRNDPNSAYCILRNAFPFYERVAASTASSGRQLDSREQEQVDGHLALAEYCDRVLRSLEERKTSAKVDTSAYPDILTEHLLLSMKNGCKRAQQLFPRLIEVSQKYPHVSDILKTTASSVPCWMFLGWISQMTAVLDEQFGSNFHGIIENILHAYPEALVYCFGISKESYEFGSSMTSGVDRANKEFVERTTQKLEMVKGVKELIRALLLFSAPDAEVKDMRLRVNSLKVERNLRKKRLLQFYTRLFMLDYSDAELGAFWKGFREKFQSKFDALFGPGCGKLLEKDSESVEKFASSLLDKFGDEIKEFCKHKNLPRNLASYSQWLSEYDAGRLGYELEIPGQYSGEEMPIIEKHVRISGFSSDVTAFSSLRIPKKLTIRGNDGKEYAFIVKQGEDLRQDERIQRLFGQMNRMFVADAECRRLNVAVKTYSVVPLTSRLGIIDFVPNTKTLRDLLNITEEMTNKAHEWIFGPGRIVKSGERSQVQRAYLTSFSETSHDNAARCFQTAERCIAKNLLREAILRLCASPDGFHCLRSQFTSSYSTMCIAGYTLGVGDRHLGNIMIDETSATAVAIDFGHAFGGGVANGIPELMPFRLTQQIRELFEPVGVHGQARGAMAACLRCVRENSYVLVNTMNVFINEPSLDWKLEAQKRIQAVGKVSADQQSSSEKTATADDISTVFALTRSEAVKRRLRGENPVTVMEDELNKVPKVMYNRSRAIEIIYGKRDDKPVSESDRQRPRGYPLTGLGVEEQVCCLIDMAADPLILARTWCGWAPWI